MLDPKIENGYIYSGYASTFGCATGHLVLFRKRYTADSETGRIWLLPFLDVLLVTVLFEKRTLPQTIYFIFKMLGDLCPAIAI